MKQNTLIKELWWRIPLGILIVFNVLFSTYLLIAQYNRLALILIASTIILGKMMTIKTKRLVTQETVNSEINSGKLLITHIYNPGYNLAVLSIYQNGLLFRTNDDEQYFYTYQQVKVKLTLDGFKIESQYLNPSVMRIKVNKLKQKLIMPVFSRAN